MASRKRQARITVNPAVCDGFGFCGEILPEMIGRDEWGFPILDDREVPEPLRRAAAQAVACCPRRALRLEPVARPVKRLVPSGEGNR